MRSMSTSEQDFLYQRKYAVSSDGEDSPQGDISSGGMSNKNTEWTQNSYTWVSVSATSAQLSVQFVGGCAARHVVVTYLAEFLVLVGGSCAERSTREYARVSRSQTYLRVHDTLCLVTRDRNNARLCRQEDQL